MTRSVPPGARTRTASTAARRGSTTWWRRSRISTLAKTPSRNGSAWASAAARWAPGTARAAKRARARERSMPNGWPRRARRTRFVPSPQPISRQGNASAPSRGPSSASSTGAKPGSAVVQWKCAASAAANRSSAMERLTAEDGGDGARGEVRGHPVRGEDARVRARHDVVVGDGAEDGLREERAGEHAHDEGTGSPGRGEEEVGDEQREERHEWRQITHKIHRRGADDDEVERGERCRQHQHRRPRPECDHESERRRERHRETTPAAQRDGEVVPEGATQRRPSGVGRHRREPERLPRGLRGERGGGGRGGEGGGRAAG